MTTHSGARFCGCCRGQGLGYLALAVAHGVMSVGVPSVRAVTSSGIDVPCSVYELPPFSGAARSAGLSDQEHLLAVVIPLLNVDVTVTATNCTGALLSQTVFGAKTSKVQSRLLTMLRPALAAALRGIERRRSGRRALAFVAEVWPQHEDNVCRISCVMPTSDARAALAVSVADGAMRPVDARTLVLEDHVVPSAGEPSLTERMITVSVTLPAAVGTFVATLSLEGQPACHAFAAGYASIVAGMRGASEACAHGWLAQEGYATWFEAHQVTPEQLAWQRSESARMAQDPQVKAPLISIVVPVYNTPLPFLRACLDSVIKQSWQRWELVCVNASPDNAAVCELLAGTNDERVRVVEVKNTTIAENTNAGIAAAQGDYVGFLDHDDVLEPDALWRYAQAIMAEPKTDLLYCDEDRLVDGHPANPAFKWGADLTHLRAHNYVTHLLMVSRRVLEAAERSGADVSGAQDFDLTLKAFECAREVAHIPRVLYHWRDHPGSTAAGSGQKPYAHTAGALALKRHLERVGLVGTVADGPLDCTYDVQLAVPEPAPRVSIVVPSRDHHGLLRRCVESILARSTYPDYEVIVVENGSSEQETFALYRELEQGSPRVRVVTWTPDRLPEGAPSENGFNYSALVNYGAAAATGQMLVFLNNDTQVIAPNWLERMVGEFQRPEVGVVGAKLLFEDGLVQHAGMIANGNGDFAHVNRNLDADELGYAFTAGTAREYSMVTGACQMVPRGLFEELGGYDVRLAVGFNDGDFCLRAREHGFKVVYQPAAVLMHREFSSRGREAVDKRLRARLAREKALMHQVHPEFFSGGDPALNPNLDPMSDWWRLRQQ